MDIPSISVLAGAGIVGAAGTKLVDLLVGRWASKTANAIETMPALATTVQELQGIVGKLQGLVQQVAEHDWKLQALTTSVATITAQQEVQKQGQEDLKSKLQVMAEKANHADSRMDELKADFRQFSAKMDAFADRVQNAIMDRSK